MQENPMINRQDGQKITLHGSAYSKISQQCTPTTYTEAVHCQRVLLGSSIPVSDHWRLLDPPFGGGSPNLSSARWHQYPLTRFVLPTVTSGRCLGWYEHGL